MKDIEQKISKWIREKRLSKNLDVRALSKLSGVTTSQISRIENGFSSITCQALVRLCFGLGVKSQEFATEFGFGELSYRETIRRENIKILPLELTVLDLEAFKLAYQNSVNPNAVKADLTTSWLNILKARDIFPGDLEQIATEQINNATLIDNRAPLEYPSEISMGFYDNGSVISYLDSGEYLRRERKHRHKTLMEVQKTTGIPQSILSRIENGEMEKIRFDYTVQLNSLFFDCDPNIISIFWTASEFHTGIELTRAFLSRETTDIHPLKTNDFSLDPFQDTLLRIARWCDVCGLHTWLDKERAKWGMYKASNKLFSEVVPERYLAPDFFEKAWDELQPSFFLLFDDPIDTYTKISQEGIELRDLFLRRLSTDPVFKAVLLDYHDFSYDHLFGEALRSRLLKVYLTDEQLRDEIYEYITEHFPDFVE